MSQQTTSVRENLDRWDEKVFCGRDAEIALFKEVLLNASKATSILAIYGIGGVGKSTLVRAYMRHAILGGAMVGFTSADNSASPVAILTDLSNQLCSYPRTKTHFSGFLRNMERLHQIETKLRRDVRDGDNATASKVAIEAVKGGIGSSVGAVVGTAIAGPFGAIAGGTLGGALMPLVESISRSVGHTFNIKGLSKSDAEFFAEMDIHLTGSFLRGVNSLASDNNRVVLFFDAIEYLGETTHWLRDGLFAGLRDTGIVVVLAGRYELPRDKWFK